MVAGAGRRSSMRRGAKEQRWGAKSELGKGRQQLSCLVRAELKSSLKDHLSLVGHVKGKLQARG